ncbi:hypothetical protein A4A49_34280 [Nicotiana attenuata]|uniref:BHLH domain-containing protein n=1 Tax=Nicotiana attenuata TaxID=49451 RepID=A0A1J6JUT4_NICAT|nr:hypothetical protein A4A49_34280 [Nicotiana attenuata]
MGYRKRLGVERVLMKSTKNIRRIRGWRRSRMSCVLNDDLQQQQDKVVKLQRLIPGARQLHSHQLLLQTANYIMQLKLQIHVLQSLLVFSSSPDHHHAC